MKNGTFMTQSITRGAAPTRGSMHSVGKLDKIEKLDKPIGQALRTHNRMRRRHGALAVRLDDSLMDAAETWSKRCVFEHNPAAIEGQFSENICWGYAATAEQQIRACLNLMYGEKNVIDPSSDPETWFFQGAGHFITIIWKNVRRVGISIRRCGDAWFTVFDYNRREGGAAENVEL